MPVARPEPPETRVIAHVDLDCFYVQVEQRRHPELKGKPTAVVMYNPWKGGGIIAVGYEARGAGVSRSMRGDDARKVCPDINLIQVPTHFGKADLTAYRDAGSEVVAIFSRAGACERASIDEVYLDLTEAAVSRLQDCPPDADTNFTAEVLGMHIIGLDELVGDADGSCAEDQSGRMDVKGWLCRGDAPKCDQLLACGAVILAGLRAAVLEETGFTTSAGIAHNKMLAKLASGLHKPAGQTVVPYSGAPGLLAPLPIKKLKGLGGKLGKAVGSDLQVKTVGDLFPYPESKLQDLYGANTGTWLWRVARGKHGDEVQDRTLSKSHGCGKTFPGPKALKALDSVAYWLSELAGELQERLDEDLIHNNRTARLLFCHAACHLVKKGDSSSAKPFSSKSCAIRYGKEKIASDALMLFKRALGEFCPKVQSVSPKKGESAGSLGHQWAVTGLSISASNIVDASGLLPITQFFASAPGTCQTTTASEPISISTAPASPSLLQSTTSSENSGQQGLANPRDPLVADSSGATGSGASTSGSVQGEYKLAADITGASITERPKGSRHPGAVTQRSDASTPVQTTAPCSETLGTSAQRSVIIGNAGRAGRSVDNEVGHEEDSNVDLCCTPRFGTLGRPIPPLKGLGIPQEAPDPIPSCHGAVVQPMAAGCPVGSSQMVDQATPGVSRADAVVYSPALEEKRDQFNDAVDRGKGRICKEDCTNTVSSELGLPVNGGDGSAMGGSPDPHADFALLQDSSSIPPTSVGTESARFVNMDDSSQSRCLQSSGRANNATGQQVLQGAPSSKRLVFQRVDELWGKSMSSPDAKRGVSGARNYKHDIDERVLSELPEEIQSEVRKQFGLKRPKTVTGTTSTIGDYFRK